MIWIIEGSRLLQLDCLQDTEGDFKMPALAFIQNLGFPELLTILVIVLLLFGAGRLPEIARAIGKSAGELKKGLKETQKEMEGTPGDDGKKP